MGQRDRDEREEEHKRTGNNTQISRHSDHHIWMAETVAKCHAASSPRIGSSWIVLQFPLPQHRVSVGQAHGVLDYRDVEVQCKVEISVTCALARRRSVSLLQSLGVHSATEREPRAFMKADSSMSTTDAGTLSSVTHFVQLRFRYCPSKTGQS